MSNVFHGVAAEVTFDRRNKSNTESEEDIITTQGHRKGKVKEILCGHHLPDEKQMIDIQPER